jgi:RNA methyltransferase, TrmH family
MERITSSHNPLLKLARNLLDAPRERRKQNRTVLDGVHLVQAYRARFGAGKLTLLVSDSGLKSAEIRALVEGAPDRVTHVSDSLFASVSPVETPTGVIAIAEIPQVEPRAQGSDEFWVVLDGVQDPGNLGSILRTAAATGATRALLAGSCADPWSPKSLRGGMGAQFVLPVTDHADLWQEIAAFEGTVYAADAKSGRALFDCDLKGACAVLFGSEGAGLSKELRTQADATLAIPIVAGVESLNVAAAVAMVCYERLRQMRS